jgi:hypothetical protein
MTLQDLMQEAQGLTWQEQLHLATRLLQWAEAQMANHQESPQRYANHALTVAADNALDPSQQYAELLGTLRQIRANGQAKYGTYQGDLLAEARSDRENSFSQFLDSAS